MLVLLVRDTTLVAFLTRDRAVTTPGASVRRHPLPPPSRASGAPGGAPLQKVRSHPTPLSRLTVCSALRRGGRGLREARDGHAFPVDIGARVRRPRVPPTRRHRRCTHRGRGQGRLEPRCAPGRFGAGQSPALARHIADVQGQRNRGTRTLNFTLQGCVLYPFELGLRHPGSTPDGTRHRQGRRTPGRTQSLPHVDPKSVVGLAPGIPSLLRPCR